MPRRRASMREGPLAELFRATEAAQRQAEKEGKPDEPAAPVEEAKAAPTPVEPPEKTVEHVPDWEEEAAPTPPPPPSEPVRLPERALEKAIAPVKDTYDYILIDTPPSLGLLTINALVASNGVIVPVQCEYLSLRGLVQLENTLSMIRENLNPEVGIEGILPTMYDSRTLHAREAVEILQENFGDLVFNTRIRKTVRYAEAPVKGNSVLKYDPSGAAAEAYRDLAKEVLDAAKAREHA